MLFFVVICFVVALALIDVGDRVATFSMEVCEHDLPMNSTSIGRGTYSLELRWVGSRTGYKTMVHTGSYITTVQFHIQAPPITLSGFVVDTYNLGIHGDVTISAWSLVAKQHT